MTSFNLYHLFIGPISRCSHVGVQVSIYTPGGGGHKHSIHRGLLLKVWFLGQQLQAAPGCSLETQAPRPHPRRLESEFLIRSPEISYIHE